MGIDLLLGGPKYAMSAWRDRQEANRLDCELAECDFCRGSGMIYSGDLRKPVGDGMRCDTCGGMGRVVVQREDVERQRPAAAVEYGVLPRLRC